MKEIPIENNNYPPRRVETEHMVSGKNRPSVWTLRKAAACGAVTATVAIAFFVGVACTSTVAPKEVKAYQPTNHPAVVYSLSEVIPSAPMPTSIPQEPEPIEGVEQADSRDITLSARGGVRDILEEDEVISQPELVENSLIPIRRDLLSEDLQQRFTEEEIAQRCKDAMPYILEFFPGEEGLALMVAFAESKCDPNATNHNSNGTIDRGYFQMNSINRMLVGGDALRFYDQRLNVEAAAKLRQGGWSLHWSVCSGYMKGLDNRVNCGQ